MDALDESLSVLESIGNDETESSQRSLCLIPCCISYLNDDSGILEEEIKGEKKIIKTII